MMEQSAGADGKGTISAMKTVLFINSCVGQESRTLRLSRFYLDLLAKKEEIAVNEVKLFESELLPLNGITLRKRDEDIRNGRLELPEYRCARDFASADSIVIGAPYWDNSFPSVLKVYLEHVCVNGITFAYDAEGRPLPLCRAKQLCYITTAGGQIGAHDSGERYLKDMCEMFGIPAFQSYRAEGLDIWGCDVEKTLAGTMETIRAAMF